MSEQPNEPACAVKQIIVSKSELPLSCPMPDMILWNAHPKVYLPIEKTGSEVCPYCGTHFILEGVDRPL